MKIVSMYKFIRVFKNKDCYDCDVAYREVRDDGKNYLVSGKGLYLSGFLYINPKPNEFYRIKCKDVGKMPLDLMFQRTGLIKPF